MFNFLSWMGRQKTMSPRFTAQFHGDKHPARTFGDDSFLQLWYRLTWKLDEDLARPTLPTLQSLPSHTTALFSTVGASSCTPPWANSYRPFKQKKTWTSEGTEQQPTTTCRICICWLSVFPWKRSDPLFLGKGLVGVLQRWPLIGCSDNALKILNTGGFRYDFTQSSQTTFCSHFQGQEEVTVLKGFSKLVNNFIEESKNFDFDFSTRYQKFFKTSATYRE
jgi:hypothetical protein